MMKKLLTLSSISLALLSTGALASEHMIIAPECLLKHVQAPYKTISFLNHTALISTNEAGVNALIAAKNQRSAKPCGGFMDVTESYKEKDKNASERAFLAKYASTKKPTKKKNYSIKYAKVVTPVLNSIDSQAMWDDLAHLTSYKDRSARTETGVKAAAWIKKTVEEMAQAAGRHDVKVYYVKTGNGSYIQPSVVAKLGDAEGPGVVIGGHMDTLTSTYELKPGADDDGSGTTTVLGVTRTILNSGLKFKKPVYFIWYAAEEDGLVGSGYVVRHFKNKNIPVEGVLQMDMTGYQFKKDSTIWLIQDNVSKNLTSFLNTLITNYVKVPVSNTRCGYACSDHASWDQEGYEAAFPFEAKFGTEDPYIHSSQDTMDLMSLDHITNFAKLGTAFVIEMAEPVE